MVAHPTTTSANAKRSANRIARVSHALRAFVHAARLRFEELAVAYGQPLPDLIERWRTRIRLLQVTQALKLQLPALADVRLLPCADGRLVECVAPDGDPVLRTEAAPDGSRQFWPLRVAVVDGRCHVLR